MDSEFGAPTQQAIGVLLTTMKSPDNFTEYDYYSPDHDYTITEERSSKAPMHDSETITRNLSVFIYSMICLLGLMGNGLVIGIIVFKMKKSVNAIWFLNLAVADFLFNVFLPLTIIYTALGYHWVFGKGMCKVNSFFLILNMYTSVFSLAIISIDRCISVVLPIWSQNHRNPKIACLLCPFIWVLGILMSSPSLVFRDTETHAGKVICFNNYYFPNSTGNPHLHDRRHVTVNVTRFLAGFVMPMAVITVCYMIIIFRLRRIRLAKSKRPLRIIIAIIMTFFLCWCPYHVFHLLETQHHSVHRPVLQIGLPIVTAVAVANSCMNPILYVFMGQDFKKFKMTFLSRMVNALSEDTAHSSLPRRSFTKGSSVTEKETILL
ncbi:chemerin-like receptor 1 isoform X2 [Heteronotia binoei]|uniref:chemerin-like receptor 1 isoform X2 n=1 Tax=Heteronotia binoei TaxID=13085 RepID=UPI00292E1888|nr:chemerin-like receptor 1 isoform X2 [Heteronotia binoei]XP_060105320.1 chemerin-like receptor 1 isoform X2 [Heteronotia binoei]